MRIVAGEFVKVDETSKIVKVEATKNNLSRAPIIMNLCEYSLLIALGNNLPVQSPQLNVNITINMFQS